MTMHQDQARAISARRPVLRGGFAILALLATIAGWAAGARLATGISVNGQIVAAQARQIVQHPEGGRVAALHVSEGEPVVAGQLLLTLDPGPLSSDLAVIEARLFALTALRTRLESEARGAPGMIVPPDLADRARDHPPLGAALAQQAALFGERRQQADQDAARHALRRTQVEARITGILAQIGALTEQRDLIEREHTRQAELHRRGLVAEAPVLALRRDAARVEGDLAEARALIAQSRETLVEIDIAITSADAARREAALSALRDLAPEDAELGERGRALTLRIEALDIRAPLTGTVHALRIPGVGAVIRPADPVLWIVPGEQPPTVEVRIPPTDIDAVWAGQPVRVRLSALGPRDAPELTGTVARVSADAFTEEGAGAFYRAEIRLDGGALDGLADGVRLVPGMPVDVQLSTGSRRPLDALAGPLGDYFSRAFRDG